VTSSARVLHLENAARNIWPDLSALGIELARHRVGDSRNYRAALRTSPFDLILCASQVDGYGYLEALADARAAGRREPFILISGSIQEEDVVEAFKAGITDFIHVQRLSRFPYVIRRALDEAAEHRARVEADCQRFASEEHFRQLFQGDLAGIAIHEMLFDALGIPHDYRFLEVNPAFETMTGLRGKDLLGRTVRETMPHTEPAWIERYGSVVTTGTPAHFEEFSASIGRWFEVTAFSLGNRQFAVVCNDVTQRKNVERERSAHSGELRQALASAEAASQAKSHFLSMMSHEIRTPLSGIIGMADLLAQSGLSTEQAEYAKIIQECGHGLIAVIGEVLDMATIEAGRMVLVNAEFDVRQMVEEIRGLFAAATLAKGLRLVISLDQSVPHQVHGDAARLRQVLINLIGNALKFTSQGEIALTIKLIERKNDTAMILWDVSDTGPGIPQAYLPHLFEPFTQADDTTSRRHGGTGLGLAISKRLSDLMGGSLTLDTAPDQGTTFHLIIPLQCLAPGDLSSGKRPAIVPSWRRPPRILVVEDDQTCQFTIHMMLKSLGCTYSLAENGNQAIEAVRESEFDAVLMDCQMPECDGYTATCIIREQATSLRRLPIIALTANVFTEDRKRCIESGMDDFLAKPCSMDSLRACLINWVKNC